jgi:hypothetical protein
LPTQRIIATGDVRRGRDTKLVAARNRWFESISLQQRVNKLSVPEEGYRSGRSTTLRVGIRDNDPAGYDLLVNGRLLTERFHLFCGLLVLVRL